MVRINKHWLLETALGAATLLAPAAFAQVSAPPDGPTPPPPPTATAPTSKDQGPHKPITKEQAKELFKSVDDILSFVNADTKLPIEHTVKRKLITRDEVNLYLREKFDEDKSEKRMERAEIVLKKFGLLDRDFNLRPFLISLLTEQVAGFYDNKTKTVNLLDWIEPDEQKPVLAHELTHALQDQKVDLTKWSEVGLTDVAKNVEQDNAHIQNDEADTARDAVAEGQAMVVFIDYSLRPTGRTVADAPELVKRMKESVADANDSPILARAPLLLQQSLLFPYNEGLSFEASVVSKQGKEGAFGNVLGKPPSSTAEILHPAMYMAHTPVPVLRMPDIHPLIDPEWVPYDVGVMGEFDVQVLTELFGGKEIADAVSPEWAGGIYYAAQKKSAVGNGSAAPQSTASIALLYQSKWKNEDSASSFMHVYAGELPRKYSGVSERKQDEKDGEQVYTTSEGDVLLSLDGTSAFISEGFPLELARKLRDTVGSAQAEGPVRIATTPELRDPGVTLVRQIESAGMMKAVVDAEHDAVEGESR